MEKSADKAIVLWLSSIIVMVFAMVFIGGITRLTDSGLSIVDWRPIVGAIPPLSEEAWQIVFEKYQAFPEFQKVNFNMTLSEFKYIYFWEYFHRLFGRLIGLVFFIPFVYFVIKKKLDKPLAKKVFVAFVLGGLQGLMGWYMVKSGLVNRVDVSQYRLCAHLMLAFLIIGYIFYIILTIKNPERKHANKKPLSILLLCFFIVLIIQIAYGAFVAGLDAGLTYNTFPKMGRSWTPQDMFVLEPVFLNFFENTATVQFMHRSFAWLLIFIGSVIFIKHRRLNDYAQKKSIQLVLIFLFIQFCLGVATIVFYVPIAVASIHQLGAVVLFLLTINALFISYTDKSHSYQNSL